MDEEYLPDGFTFKEPSKLSKSEVYERLKFWYGRQQDGGIETVFKFRCIKGKDGKPQEVPIDEEDVLPNKRKKPNRKQRTGKKGRAEQDPKDVDQSEEDARAPARKTAPTKKGKGNMKSGPQRGGEEETSSSSEESPSESDEEEHLEDNSPARRGSSALAPPMPLPFSAPRRKLKPSPFQWAAPQPVAGPSKKRYAPATGPQYEKPNTRRRGLDGGDEGSPAKKRKTEMEGVVKTGPPKGIPRDKPMTSKKGKDRAN